MVMGTDHQSEIYNKTRTENFVIPKK